GHHLRLPPAAQLRLDPVLGRGQPQLLQPGRGGSGERRVRHVGQRRTAPPRQRVAQQLRGALSGARGQRRAPVRREPLEVVAVPARLLGVAERGAVQRLLDRGPYAGAQVAEQVTAYGLAWWRTDARVFGYGPPHPVAWRSGARSAFDSRAACRSGAQSAFDGE